VFFNKFCLSEPKTTRKFILIDSPVVIHSDIVVGIMSYGQTASNLWGPKILLKDENSSDGVELSVHTLPKPLEREFKHVFDDRNLNLETIADSTAEFLAIPTNQRALEDLVGIGEHIEAEKDRLLNSFMEFARMLCQKIRDAGYWSDFIDPCSGLPMLTMNCNKVYSEVDGMECCLGYRAYNAGFCKILTHPVWGSAVYPATMFAYAPRVLILTMVEEFPCLKQIS
jgi:hypothetical protein